MSRLSGVGASGACLAVLAALASGASGVSGCKAKAEPVTSPLGGNFEGTLTLHIESKRGGQAPFDLDLALKKDNVRVEMPKELTGAGGIGPAGALVGNGRAWAVFRAGERKGFFALEASKQAYALDLDAAGDDMKRAVPSRRSGPTGMPRGGGVPPSLKRTGQKATVAGIPCEDWELANEGERAVVCMAEESAAWLKFPTKALPDDLGFAAELLDGKHFPVRVLTFEGARETARIEVKKLEKKALPDSDFQIPAGYTTIDVAQMMKLGALGGGMPGMMPGMPGPGTIPKGMVPGLEDMPVPGPEIPAKAKPTTK